MLVKINTTLTNLFDNDNNAPNKILSNYLINNNKNDTLKKLLNDGIFPKLKFI